MRQVILDTETTGLNPATGDRIIEIGCVEMVGRRLTDRTFHYYVNPERDIDAGAFAVHGLSREFLSDKPVGMPDILPDHVSLWGSLIQFRRGFDQYVNLRPVRLLPGVPCPLANRKPGDIDFFVVRENTEGEYSSVGGKMFPDTDREFVIQESVFTRQGVDRILQYAFDLAQSRPKKHLT